MSTYKQPRQKWMDWERVRVELEDGRSYEDSTLSHLCMDLKQCIHQTINEHLNGNMSCDCNKLIHLQQLGHKVPPGPMCGDTLVTKRLVLLNPTSGEERVIWEKGK